MSILIRGMEMPKSCNACMFDVYGLCLINKNIEAEDELTHSCPLIPVPPHGDLIDRDALMDSFRESVKECHTWADEISNLAGTEADMYARVSQSLGTFVEAVLRTKAAPIIIPAEEGE